MRDANQTELSWAGWACENTAHHVHEDYISIHYNKLCVREMCGVWIKSLDAMELEPTGKGKKIIIIIIRKMNCDEERNRAREWTENCAGDTVSQRVVISNENEQNCSPIYLSVFGWLAGCLSVHVCDNCASSSLQFGEKLNKSKESKSKRGRRRSNWQNNGHANGSFIIKIGETRQAKYRHFQWSPFKHLYAIHFHICYSICLVWACVSVFSSHFIRGLAFTAHIVI